MSLQFDPSPVLREEQRPMAPVKFAGWQQTRNGDHISLWNLLEDITGHPEGSTVSQQTLLEMGYRLPKIFEVPDGLRKS